MRIPFLIMIVVMVLITLGSAFGEEMQAYVDQPTSVVTACIRNSQLRSTATATIRIYDSSYNLIVSETNMTPTGNGSFIFTHVFTSIGTYNTRETCDFSGILADGSTSINVQKPGFGNM